MVFLAVLLALIVLGAAPLTSVLSSAAHDMVGSIRSAQEE